MVSYLGIAQFQNINAFGQYAVVKETKTIYGFKYPFLNKCSEGKKYAD